MRDAGRGTVWRLGLTGAAVLWGALIVLTPGWRAAEGTTPGLRAHTAALVTVVASRICHQRPERSFHRHGRPLPVCGRCAGLYLSGALGLVLGHVPRRRSPTGQARDGDGRRAVPARASGTGDAGDRGVAFDARARWLALAAVPTVITWSFEVAGLWQPGNVVRALAALPLGATVGVLLARAFASGAAVVEAE